MTGVMVYATRWQGACGVSRRPPRLMGLGGAAIKRVSEEITVILQSRAHV